MMFSSLDIVVKERQPTKMFSSLDTVLKTRERQSPMMASSHGIVVKTLATNTVWAM